MQCEPERIGGMLAVERGQHAIRPSRGEAHHRGTHVVYVGSRCGLDEAEPAGSVTPSGDFSARTAGTARFPGLFHRGRASHGSISTLCTGRTDRLPTCPPGGSGTAADRGLHDVGHRHGWPGDRRVELVPLEAPRPGRRRRRRACGRVPDSVRSNLDIMPWGVMKGTYTPGQTYSIYTDNSSSNNGALSLPYVNNANCPVPNGADPYRDEIDGVLNSCPVSVGEQIDVKPGDNSGPTRQGIDNRITTWNSLDQIVSIGANGQATVLDSSSKQLVLIPIVEDPDGGTDWLNGSGWIRVVGFAWFVITGPPGYTNNGKTVTGVFVRPEDSTTGGDPTRAWGQGHNTDHTLTLTA